MGRRTTWSLVLELSLVGLQTIAEMLLVEGKHVTLRQYDRNICAYVRAWLKSRLGVSGENTHLVS